MNCEQAQTLFDTYLDGELSGPLAAELGAHKLSCSICRRELALLEVAGHVVAADTETPLLSDEFSERLLECAVVVQPPWYRRKRLLFYAGSPVAAAACLVLMVSYLYSSSSEPGYSSSLPSAPMVLPEGHRVESTQELLDNVEDAISQNPNNEELRHLADALRTMRAKGQEIFEDTKNGAFLLENYSKMTIMEVLESIPVDSSRNDVPLTPATNSSEDAHDSPVENL